MLLLVFFSLPVVDIEDKSSERAIDFIISPGFNRVNNKRQNRVSWMFDFPIRLYNSYDNKLKKSKKSSLCRKNYRTKSILLIL